MGIEFCQVRFLYQLTGSMIFLLQPVNKHGGLHWVEFETALCPSNPFCHGVQSSVLLISMANILLRISASSFGI